MIHSLEATMRSPLASMAHLLFVLSAFAALACRSPEPPPPAAPAAPAAPAPVSVPDPGTEIVIGKSYSLDSEVLQETRTVNVYLPASYGEGGESFPVLYLVDGGVDQDFHPISGLAALADLTAQFRRFLVVGVQTEDRRYELTTPSQLPEDLEFIPHNGGSEKFLQHLVREVKPWTEARFRTTGEDAILGESLAGLFITETFLRAPESFTHFIAVSPSLWWRDMELSREAPDLLQAGRVSSGQSFYLTIADEGGTMLEGVERVAGALEAHAPEGLRWWYEPMPQESHSTIYNPATLRALRRIFAPFPEDAPENLEEGD